MPGRRRVHKVGLAAAAAGLPAFALLAFATVRASRIQTGRSVSALTALGPGWTAVVVALWLGVIVLSLGDHRRGLAAARGFIASAIIVVVVALAGAAGRDLAAGAGPYVRISLSAGAWTTAICAYALVLASRREVGARTPLGVILFVLGPAAVVLLILGGALGALGMAREYANIQERFLSEAGRHLLFAASAVAAATLVGMALGFVAFKERRLERPVFAMVNLFQTVPGLAMIGLLVGPFAALSRTFPWLRSIGFGGLGWAPVIFALALYALLAVTRNTFAGLAGVPEETVEAGRGMGMSERQLLMRVRLPLAMPVIFTGVRTASVQTVGNATLGAFAGPYTLGLFIFGGLSQQAVDLITLGSIAVVAMALAVDGTMRGVQLLATPRRRRTPIPEAGS